MAFCTWMIDNVFIYTGWIVPMINEVENIAAIFRIGEWDCVMKTWFIVMQLGGGSSLVEVAGLFEYRQCLYIIHDLNEYRKTGFYTYPSAFCNVLFCGSLLSRTKMMRDKDQVVSGCRINHL